MNKYSLSKLGTYGNNILASDTITRPKLDDYGMKSHNNPKSSQQLQGISYTPSSSMFKANDLINNNSKQQFKTVKHYEDEEEDELDQMVNDILKEKEKPRYSELKLNDKYNFNTPSQMSSKYKNNLGSDPRDQNFSQLSSSQSAKKNFSNSKNQIKTVEYSNSLNFQQKNGGSKYLQKFDDDEDDVFEHILKQSIEKDNFSRFNKEISEIKHVPQHTPDKNDYDVDDLLDELKREDTYFDAKDNNSGKEIAKGVTYNEKSEKIYRQLSSRHKKKEQNTIASKQEKAKIAEQGFQDQLKSDQLTKFLIELKNRFCIKAPQETQESMNQTYKTRRGVARAYEIFSEPCMKTGNEKLKCWVKGVPVDGRLVAKARFSEKSSMYQGYSKLEFDEGDSVIIISASIENTYLLFGFKETQLTLQRMIESADIYAIESTTVQPQYEIYPPGNRLYELFNWDDIGFDPSCKEEEPTAQIEPTNFGSYVAHTPGEVPIIQNIYLAIKDFNTDDKEPPLTKNRVQILSFRAGELIIMTLNPNKGGWFEGYRHNDPERICGIAHKSSLKKINFK